MYSVTYVGKKILKIVGGNCLVPAGKGHSIDVCSEFKVDAFNCYLTRLNFFFIPQHCYPIQQVDLPSLEPSDSQGRHVVGNSNTGDKQSSQG